MQPFQKENYFEVFAPGNYHINDVKIAFPPFFHCHIYIFAILTATEIPSTQRESNIKEDKLQRAALAPLKAFQILFLFSGRQAFRNSKHRTFQLFPCRMFLSRAPYEFPRFPIRRANLINPVLWVDSGVYKEIVDGAGFETLLATHPTVSCPRKGPQTTSVSSPYIFSHEMELQAAWQSWSQTSNSGVLVCWWQKRTGFNLKCTKYVGAAISVGFAK